MGPMRRRIDYALVYPLTAWLPHARQHDRFHDGEIQQLIRRLGLRPGLDHDHRTDHGSLGPGQWWLATLAREIGMPVATLFGWLKRGWITGRQDTRPPCRWIITADSAEVEREYIRDRTPEGHESARARGKAIGGAPATDDAMLAVVPHLRGQELSLRDIAARLVISTGKKKGRHPSQRLSCACSATTTRKSPRRQMSTSS